VFPGSSPSQAAHYSHSVTFGAQCGAITDIAQSLINIALKLDEFQYSRGVCHGSELLTS
jgi:hypothetical protein